MWIVNFLKFGLRVYYTSGKNFLDQLKLIDSLKMWYSSMCTIWKWQGKIILLGKFSKMNCNSYFNKFELGICGSVVWHFIHWAMKLVKQIYWSKQFHISFVSKCYNILLWKLKSLGVEDLWFINVLAMCKFSSYMLVYLLHHLSTPTLPGAQYVCSCLAFL